MKLNFFASAESASFLNLIYHGAGTVVHLLLLKGSMVFVQKHSILLIRLELLLAIHSCLYV